ncbi:MAG: leucine-rich repeat protein [Treponemataceae bacterium]|nr:leucine-rich repeat protein [Treponemataceae bacterium]
MTLLGGVTDIGADAFAGCTDLTDVTIPASVEHIGTGAFEGCTGLERVTYGGTLEQFEALTEGNGIDLSKEKVVISDEASSWDIRDGVVFSYYGSKTDIVILGGVTAIGADAFAGNAALTGVTGIGDGAFGGCTALADMTIPASVRHIGKDALACGGLESVTFAGTVAAWRGLSGESGVGDDVIVTCSDGILPTTVYVAGTGSDDNPGSRSKPLATIQKAVDTVIARNDGASAYTIYVDGTLTQSAAASTSGMANFSALDKNLTLTITALSGTATLDANQKSRVIYAMPASGKLNLTLENLTIKGGNTSQNGGGIYFSSVGGTLTISDGTISGNTASDSGGGIYSNSAYNVTISGSAIIRKNTAGSSGGGIYIKSGSLDVKGGTISGNVATSNGGGICFSSLSAHTLEISGGTIGGASETDKNKAKNGGGVYVYGKLKMSDGSISGNTAEGMGGGVYLSSYGKFNMDGGGRNRRQQSG